jgi:photosystem II stability/assembly factor-like uncharacterized protein
VERGSSRGRRWLALGGIALAAVLVAGAILLWPRAAPHASPTRTKYYTTTVTSGPAVPPGRPAYVSFGDADHGAVTMFNRQPATFLTFDGGLTWRQKGADLSYLAFLDPDHVASAGLEPQNGFAMSGDAGRTWREGSRPAASGAFSLQLDGIVTGGPYFADPADGWWLDAGGRIGAPALWRTADGGRTWDDLAPAGIPIAARAASVQPVFVDRLRGTLTAPPIGPGWWPAVAATRDGGRTWSPASVTWPSLPALGPPGAWTASAALVARGGRLVLSLEVHAGASVLRWSSLSEDGGLTWAAWAPLPAASTVNAAPVLDDAGRLLLVDDRRLWTSSDLGASWRSRPLPLAAGRRALAVVPAQRGALFVVTERGSGAGAEEGLLRSVDGGGRWTERMLPPP